MAVHSFHRVRRTGVLSRLIGLTAGAALVLGGCGGGGNSISGTVGNPASGGLSFGSNGSNPSSTPTPEPTPQPTGTPTAPPTFPTAYETTSPDGRFVAYAQYRTLSPENGSDLFVRNAADGTGAARIYHPGLAAYYPLWSPDSERIAFINGPNNVAEQNVLAILHRDGTDYKVLYRGQSVPEAFSADGKSLTFFARPIVNGSPVEKRYRINVDGSGLTEI